MTTEAEIAEVVQRVLAELQQPVGPSQQAVNQGHFTVAAGQTVLADHMNAALQRGIPKFANEAARDAQWPSGTVPVGAFCYVQDTNILQVFDNQITGGSNAWHPAGGLRMGYATMGGPTGNQIIPNGSVETLVKLDTVGGAANRPGRATWAADGSVVVPITGTYLITGGICWPANSTGERRLYIKQYTSSWIFSGTAGGASEINTGAVGSTLLRQSVTAMAYMNAGAKVGMLCQHSATANLTLAVGADQARLGVHLLGAD